MVGSGVGGQGVGIMGSRDGGGQWGGVGQRLGVKGSKGQGLVAI